MKFTPTSLPGVVLVEPEVFTDNRGFFMETWRADRFRHHGIEANFVQDNHSRSLRGTMRGLHYQIEQPQGKLIRVIAGRAFDVAVDLRRSSKYFGCWTAAILSAENKRLIWIPAGFAHGCMTLSDFAEFEYRCTDYYASQHERTIQWNDPEIGIEWPESNSENLIISRKDEQGVPLAQAALYE